MKKQKKRNKFYSIWDFVVLVFPTVSSEDQANVVKEIRKSSTPNFDYYLLILVASFIATIGIISDNDVIVIGATLVSPLMLPILGIGMSITKSNKTLLKNTLKSTLKGCLIILSVSITVGIIFSIDTQSNTMLSHGSPNILDLMVALFAGVAAAYATCRKNVSAALPGVAVAVSLLPPLCTAGYAIGIKEVQTAVGAFLLFGTNAIAIVFASVFIFLALGFRSRSKVIKKRGIQATVVILLLITSLLFYITFISIRDYQRIKTAQELIRNSFNTNITRVHSVEIEKVANEYLIDIIVKSFGELDDNSDLVVLGNELQNTLKSPIELNISVIRGGRYYFNVN